MATVLCNVNDCLYNKNKKYESCQKPYIGINSQGICVDYKTKKAPDSPPANQEQEK